MQKSAQAFIDCGDALIQAKNDMLPDDFTKMIREDLPFKQHKAWELIHIAERPWIKNYTDKLPVHWTVLGMIAKLEEVEFLEKIGDGTINPHMTGAELNKCKPVYEADDEEKTMMMTPASE